MSTGPADERIDIAVTLRDELSKPARRVEEKIDDIGESAEEASPKVDALGESIKKTGEESEKATANVRALSDETRRNTRHLSDHRRTVSATEVVYRALNNTVRNYSRSLGNGIVNRYRAITNATKNFRAEHSALIQQFQKTRSEGGKMLGFFGNYFTVLKLLKGAFSSDLFLFVPQLVTGVFSLGAAAAASVGPIGSLAGNLGLLAPGIALMMQLMAVTKMGFGGVGELATLLSDPNADAEAIASALKGLGPNARKFALELANVQKAFKPIRTEVQETFLDGLGPTLKSITEQYLPVMQRNLVGTARGLNSALKYAGDIYGRSENLATFDRVMARGAKNSTLAGRGMAQFLLLMLRVTDAAGPAFDRVLTSVVDRIEMLANIADDGGLERFFNRSATTAMSFMQIVRDLSVGIYRFTSAAAPLSTILGTGLKGMAADFRAFTGSTAGQQRISEFFTKMIPNVRALGNLVGSLARALVGMSESPFFAALVNDLANNGIPALLRLFQTLESTVTPVILDLGAALSTVEDYPNFFQPLADVLSILVAVLRVAIPLWNDLPGPLQQTLAYAVGLSAMGMGLATILSLWGGGFKLLVGLLRIAVPFLGRLGGYALTGAGGMTALTAAASALLGPLSIVSGLVIFGNMAVDAQAAKVNVDSLTASLKAMGAAGSAQGNGLSQVGKIGWVPGLGPKTSADTVKQYGQIADIAGKGFGARFARVISLGVSSRTFDAQTKAFDDSLANLVKGGNVKEAKSSFDQLMASVAAAGNDVGEVSGRFKAYHAAMEAANPSTVANARAQEEMASGLRGTNGELLTQSQRLQNNIDKMNQASGMVLSLRDAQRQYQDTLAAAKNAVDQNGKNLDITTEKGRANQTALDNIARSGLSVIDSMRQNNATQQDLQATMQATRDDFVRVAESMGMSAADAQNLANQLNLIPANVVANVSIVASGVETTLNKLNGVLRTMQTINGTTVTTSIQTRGPANGLGSNQVARGLVARFSGGSVRTGQDYVVNEKGPEAFVSNTGKVGMLGNGYMTQMRFNEPGYVVPANVTAGGDDGGVPDRYLTALRRAQDAQYMTDRREVPRPRSDGSEGPSGGGDVYVTVKVGGSVVGEVDIEKAARAGVRRAEREKRRRSR